MTSAVISHSCYPNTERQEDHEFEASLGYITSYKEQSEFVYVFLKLSSKETEIIV